MQKIFFLKLFFYVFLAFLSVDGLAQRVETWQSQLSYHNVTSLVAVENKIYALANGDIFTYDFQNSEVETWSKIDGLHDVGVKLLAYNKATKTVMIVYKNANIDLIQADGTIVNLPYLYKSNWHDKTVNTLNFVGEEAFLGVGVNGIVFNLRKAEISKSYSFKHKVNSLTGTKQQIIVATANGVFVGNRQENLLNPQAWRKISSERFHEISLFSDQYYATKEDGLYLFNVSTNQTTKLVEGAFLFTNLQQNPFILGTNNAVSFFYPATKDCQSFPMNTAIFGGCFAGNYFFSAEGYRGLGTYLPKDKSLEPVGTPLVINSPIRNYAYFSTMNTDQTRFLVAGGALNYANLNFEGTAMFRDEDGRWTNLEDKDIASKIERWVYVNTTAIAEDPVNKQIHYVSTAGNGVLVFENAKFIKQYDNRNSPLQTILPNDPNARDYVRVDGLKFDANRNLWIVNNQVDTPLFALKPDGSWKSFFFESISKHPTLEKMHIDKQGRIWILSRRETNKNDGGIFMFQPNNLDDDSDDISYFRSAIENQDGIVYKPHLYNAIAEDKGGKIWIGTNNGPFVIANKEEFDKPSFTFTQIKIPRNDGTDYADYLLNEINITALAVDGANCKWIGTDFGGLYAVSPDGQSILKHFTAENSSLPSNNIQSLSIKESTGEVLIGTDKGLMSYFAEGTLGSSQVETSMVKVYPNPVKEDYTGKIAIRGLAENAMVKITDIAGKLVVQGKALGGTFLWDGRFANGSHVPVGIYFVLVASANGQEGMATKIAVTR